MIVSKGINSGRASANSHSHRNRTGATGSIPLLHTSAGGHAAPRDRLLQRLHRRAAGMADGRSPRTSTYLPARGGSLVRHPRQPRARVSPGEPLTPETSGGVSGAVSTQMTCDRQCLQHRPGAPLVAVECGSAIATPDVQPGQTMRCPNCGRWIVLPIVPVRSNKPESKYLQRNYLHVTAISLRWPGLCVWEQRVRPLRAGGQGYSVARRRCVMIGLARRSGARSGIQ